MSALPEYLEPPAPLLLHVVESDDLVLDGDGEVVWFDGVKAILRNWPEFLPAAMVYYEALFNFNQDKAARRRDTAAPSAAEWFGTEEPPAAVDFPASVESPEEARLRLMGERPTAGNTETPVVRIPVPPGTPPKSFNPAGLSPGHPPQREAGRTPVDFFYLLAAFVGSQFMGREATADSVHSNLRDNPSFARACNFSPGGGSNSPPSLRMLQQFDQIMAEKSIWTLVNLTTVNGNLESGLVKPEENLVHDTTHHIAYSGFETVDRGDGSVTPFNDPAAQGGETSGDADDARHPTSGKSAKNVKPLKSNKKNNNSNGCKTGGKSKRKIKSKRKKKSQSKLTKKCQCAERDKCGHPWKLADDGAGTVVKHANKVHWAHKASILGLPDQGVPLVALAVTDAASHDSKTLFGTLSYARETMPQIVSYAKRLLDDSAVDDHNLKKLIKNVFDLDVNSSINPKGCKTITAENLPKGMSRLTPAGYLHCLNGHTMNYLGTRKKEETYLFGPPLDETGIPFCEGCPLKASCCNRDNNSGRHVAIPFEMIPRAMPENPPMAKRFQQLMKKRPAVERMIFRLKCQLGERYLHKQGNHNYQATLDKSMIAFHLLLRL